MESGAEFCRIRNRKTNRRPQKKTKPSNLRTTNPNTTRSNMNEIVNLVERLGYPIAVSVWLMWFVSAFAARIQRLVEWAIAAKHQLDHIELLAQQVVASLPSAKQEVHNNDDAH